MPTDNFLKKFHNFIFSFALVMFCVCNFIYAGIVASAKRVNVNASFYFLVTEDTKTEVGAEFAKLQGGAGYLLSHNGAEYVTLAVYLEEREGLAVQKRLKESGKTTLLLQKSAPTLWFKGTERLRAKFIVGGLNTLKSYIDVLKQTIDSLDGGMSQEKCKGILSAQLRQYTYAKEYYKEYAELSEVFDKSAQQLFAIARDIVYVRDLRYLLCWQTENYIALCSKFSI